MLPIGGVHVDILTEQELNHAILSAVQNKSQRIFYHVNARLIGLANNEAPWIRDAICSHSANSYCDGVIVQIYARLTERIVPQKLGFAQWIWSFLEFAQVEGLRPFFLGSTDTSLAAIQEILSDQYPRLDPAGFHHGYFDKVDVETNSALCELINTAAPDVLFVAFGMPLQERWILDHHQELSAAAILGCGAGFDYMAGRVSLAPDLVRRAHLEWLYRAAVEPRRLLWRNIRDVWRGIYYTVKHHCGVAR